MSFINPDATFNDQANRVMVLYQRLGDVREEYVALETDARRVSLNNMMMAANAAAATLKLLSWAKSGGETALIQCLGLARPEYINQVAEDMLRASKLFLLLESQFQTENLFRNILRCVGSPAGTQGFFNVARDVLTFAGIPDIPGKLRVLNVPALLRNCMHSNGIHHGWNGTSTVETITGVEYRFEHGKRVQCGSWFHIVTALSASLIIVEEILSSAAIRTLAEIPDAYAEQRAGDA
jgi:hypothetical protein